nr:NAD(P)/FAD-dependent oxidoreductase [Sneathiella limimaris]
MGVAKGLQTEFADESGVLDVLIIGAGFSGLCAGYYLKKEGVQRFLILEKTDNVGGTWNKNRYPGAACDVPSHFYCFSFALNPDWSRVYSPQAEILAYLENCANEFELRPHLKFNQEVQSIRFDEKDQIWRAQIDEETVIAARQVIIGSGGLNTPYEPELDGLSDFKGPVFHTAKWRDDVELKDKEIVVVGSAASAVQAVPELAKMAKRVTMFQRTPNYVIPRQDRAYTEAEKARFRKSKWRLKLERLKIYLRFEYVLSPFFKKHSWLRSKIEDRVKRHILSSFSDRRLAKSLIPDYDMGCKRILISDDFYPALARENVDVNTNGIHYVDHSAVIDRAGNRISADLIVLATGFDLQGQMTAIDIQGRKGVHLSERWDDLPGAYLGAMVDGFPNLYFMTGPNTGVGSTSIVHMIEAQMQFVLQCLKKAGNTHLLEPTPDAVARYNQFLQGALTNTVWAGSCKSWYKDEEGRNFTLYPKPARFFWRERKKLNLKDMKIWSRSG